MPFKKETVTSQQIQQLQPVGVFDPNSTFGQRIALQRDEKQRVAWYVATRWLSEGRPDAFITDGSSTFYVCLAASLIQRQQTAHLCTNNLAISTELDARGDVQNLDLELLGGKRDPQLDATLGERAMSHASEFLDDCNLVISSVRELSPDRGPTAPERESRRIKKIAMSKANLLVIVAEWRKLSTPPLASADLVFADNEKWTNLLANKEIWVVSSAPQTSFTSSSFECGRHIVASHRDQKAIMLQPHEKYALNVFLLSERLNVNFIEVR